MPTQHETARADIEALVHRTIISILPGLPAGAIDGGRHLKELGADSVDRVEIIMALIEEVGIEADMARFSEIPSVDALVQFLWEEQS
ncbi:MULTISPECIES: acyl carrier protein [unclassified Streptomyces]|uniref:acyl carrier protein n=1 Tax=unclassified Streptomyces TaxID=2593676 RepID=UPI002E29A6FC|nr:acyl carrier protein [Streptomyces sp. NBC_00441]